MEVQSGRELVAGFALRIGFLRGLQRTKAVCAFAGLLLLLMIALVDVQWTGTLLGQTAAHRLSEVAASQQGAIQRASTASASPQTLTFKIVDSPSSTIGLVTSFVTGDFNSDGFGDLALGIARPGVSSGEHINVLLSNGSSSFQAADGLPGLFSAAH